MSSCGVGNKTSENRSPTHFTLLSSLPSIRMRKNKIDLTLHRIPQVGTISMGILDITRNTLQKVSKEIGKDFHDGLVQWKGGNIVCNITSCADFRSKMKFKPDIFLIRLFINAR